MTESLLLSVLGCGLGLAFAVWGQQAILGFLPAEVSEPFAWRPDGTVLAFTLGISLMAAALFGLAPAWRSTAVDPAAGLRGDGGRTTRRPVLRRALVVAQVSLSVVLVALAGLFGGSLARLRAVDVGFRNRSVLALQLDCPANWGRARRPQVVICGSGVPVGGSGIGELRVSRAVRDGNGERVDPGAGIGGDGRGFDGGGDRVGSAAVL